MKNTKQRTESHLSQEEITLLDEFMDETSLLSTSNKVKNENVYVSPESLLTVLNDAKKLAHSLRSNQVLIENNKEITTRLTHIETEIADIKLKISKI